MDISCDIIRDLLPLYAEDLVSEDSRKLVDEHLCSCDPCTKQLGILKKATQLPVEVDTASLKRVGDTIRRRKILTVAAVIMALLSIIVTIFTFLLTPYALTAEEAIDGVELREDGGLAIDYASGINGTGGQGIFDPDNYGILCHTNRYDWYQAKKQDQLTESMSREELETYIAKFYGVDECTQKEWDRFHNVSIEYGVWEAPNGERFVYPYVMGEGDMEGWKQISAPADRNLWYINAKTGDGELLIWDGGKDMPTSVIMLTTDGYGYAFWGCLLFSVLCYLMSRDITGIWKEILRRATIILSCLAASILLVTGGQLRTIQYWFDNQWIEAIYLETLVLSLNALLWYQLHRLNKQDKGL